MSAEIKNIGASVRQRLKNRAHELKIPFNQILQRFAIERFLFRLSHSQHKDKFVLKGAQMLVVWGGSRFRPTMDIDLHGLTSNTLENLEAIVGDICDMNDEKADALLFDASSVTAVRIKEDAEYEGVRITCDGRLDSAKLHVQIDVGFDDAITPAPETVCYPSLLGMSTPELRAYNRESLIAEKFEAMVTLGELNSRMKDFFDIWLLSQQFTFHQRELANALLATFERRGTALGAMPTTLAEVFPGIEVKEQQWRAFLRKSNLGFAPPQFREVAILIFGFLSPVVDAINGEGMLDATWSPAGPWST